MYEVAIIQVSNMSTTTRSRNLSNKLNQLHRLADNGFPIPMEMWLKQQSSDQLKDLLASSVENYFGFQPLIVAIVGLRPSKFGDDYSALVARNRAQIDQRSPVADASIEQRTQTIRLMLQHGCDPNIRSIGTRSFISPPGLTPLYSAVRAEFAEVIPLLVEFGAYLEKSYFNNKNPLILSARLCVFREMKVLIELGLDVDDYDDGPHSFWQTALHLCAKHPLGHSCIKLLIANGAYDSMYIRDRNDYLPVHLTVLGGNADSLLELINSGSPLGSIEELYDVAYDCYIEEGVASGNKQRFLDTMGVIKWVQRRSFLCLAESCNAYNHSSNDHHDHIVKYIFDEMIIKEICSYL